MSKTKLYEDKYTKEDVVYSVVIKCKFVMYDSDNNDWSYKVTYVKQFKNIQGIWTEIKKLECDFSHVPTLDEALEELKKVKDKKDEITVALRELGGDI